MAVHSSEMTMYTNERLQAELAECRSGTIGAWWDRAHRLEHPYWLSGTPGEEVWRRLEVRERLIAGASILNIGVGLGHCTRALVDMGCSVSVLDISDVALGRVADVARGWTTPQDLPAAAFDLALSHLVAQHMIDVQLEEQIFHVLRSLKDTGLFALQYAVSASGQRSSQCSKNAKGGSILRRPEDIDSFAAEAGGRVRAQFERERHACGTVWMVAHITR